MAGLLDIIDNLQKRGLLNIPEQAPQPGTLASLLGPATTNPNLMAQMLRAREQQPATSPFKEYNQRYPKNWEQFGANVSNMVKEGLPQPQDPLELRTQKLMNLVTAMGPQVIKTSGLPNGGRELIRSKADELGEALKKHGFNVKVEYSGSAAGPSAYVNVTDPTTGRFLTVPARVSGHSKGPFNSQLVHEITDDPSSSQQFIDAALELRSKGPSDFLKSQPAREAEMMKMRYQSAQKKIAKGKSLTYSEQEAVNILGGGTEDLRILGRE